MPQKVIKFTGINRKVNEFQNTGACEELINLRPTMTGLEVVKPKVQKFNGVEYDVYTHSFGNTSNFIGVLIEQDSLQLYLISDSGDVSLISELIASGPDYSIAFLGNQILLTHNTTLYAYEYKNERYNSINASVPDLDITYTVSYKPYTYTQISSTTTDPSTNEFKNAVMQNWSAAVGQNNNKDEIFGPILMAVNATLSDGTEFWTNKWIYINPFISLPVGKNGKDMIFYDDGSGKFLFSSYKLTFSISKRYGVPYDATNLVKSINVYTTKPIFPYDIETMSSEKGVSDRKEVYAKVTGISNSDATSQLLYFQKSIPFDEIPRSDDSSSNGYSFTLDFGDSLVGERILEVDNGPIERAGETTIYNNRAHVYNGYITIKPQSIILGSDVHRTYSRRDAYVHFNYNGTSIVCKTTAFVPAATGDKVSCCYPDGRATKVLVATNDDATEFCTIILKQSKRYNFAWGEATFSSSYSTDDIVVSVNKVVYEPNTINVSAQFNPFVFPVEYSYSIGGKILDLTTSYIPISATMIGEGPLSVFTSNGIFALLQGDDGVLYKGVAPLQPLVINGKATPTPYGTFFVSSKALYVLSGREAANASFALNGKLEDTIREQASYEKLCCTPNGIIYNFLPLLSKEDFEAFITNATLAYDQLRNELYICSNDESIPYSYVFNIDTKAFHKISKRYTTNQNGARYAIETVGGNRNVIDLHSEVDSDRQPILLQSRPMSLEAVYTHIQRLMLMVDAKLSSKQYLFFSVFGSDNLYDWKCIISAQKSNTVLRQIRTNRAAKSYKDYIVLINGVVGSDTDLSDIIADYTVVNRRLG